MQENNAVLLSSF